MLKDLIIFTVILITAAIAEEGMWPLSEIGTLDLEEKGMEIAAQDIYNPGGLSLVNGIVRLNGCTASFVSSDGLILTNHHCAFRAIQRASSPENDYLTNGFWAEDHEAEIPAPGYRAKLIDSYHDVSDKILSGTSPDMDYEDRDKLIDQNIKKIIVAAEQEHSGKRAEIAEMFIGKTYVLFIYTELQDIRLVYAPPRSVGEFGGETDNWVWPRHTGDFSFFRAYVAPDGSPAEYAPENIAYHPKKYFQVAREGIGEEDFVFILGYPGRTYRHRTSYFLEYEEKYRMPFVVDLYSWQIDQLEKFIEEEPDKSLILSSTIKSRANTMKNYQGKLEGMARLNLTQNRRREEHDMMNAFASEPEKHDQLGNILQEINGIYAEKQRDYERQLLVSYLIRSSDLLSTARTLYGNAENRDKPDLDRESAYMDRNADRTRKRMLLNLVNFDQDSDRRLLTNLLERTQALPEEKRIKGLDQFLQKAGMEKYLTDLYQNSRLSDTETVNTYWNADTIALAESGDPAFDMIIMLLPEIRYFEQMGHRHSGALKNLHAQLIELRKFYFQEQFIPDANGTMRLTYGRIRGYSPADGVYYKPITTFSGVIEKTTGTEPFLTPPDLIRIHKNNDFGSYAYPPLGDIPVGILYDMDTTGGNSGSPVFNARGELVGVNFDRAFQATINDYAWSPDYSRSIGVDIRYILWILDKYSGARHILEDLGVQQ